MKIGGINSQVTSAGVKEVQHVLQVDLLHVWRGVIQTAGDEDYALQIF